MSIPRRIGVLTGGGDCPGLNAVLRAVTKDALFHGIEVCGIEDGFLGLIENRIRPLDYESVSGILTVGGTILGTSNKANPRAFPTSTDADGNPVFEDLSDRCMAHIEQHGLDALVCIGGDGTMTGAHPFTEAGVSVIGVPKTIDNDVFGTDLTFGHLTAVDTATEAIDRLHSTALSHHRAMVVELMGRNAGWIALSAGIASGSDVILLPEMPFSYAAIAEAVERRRQRGARATIVAVAEGARPAGGAQVVRDVDPLSPDPIRLGGIARQVAAEIEARTSVEARHVVLGHLQRGGTPCAEDRVLCTRFGHHATTLLREGRSNRMVALVGNQVTDVDIRTPAGRQRTIPPDEPLLDVARAVYTSFGVPG